MKICSHVYLYKKLAALRTWTCAVVVFLIDNFKLAQAAWGASVNNLQVFPHCSGIQANALKLFPMSSVVLGSL